MIPYDIRAAAIGQHEILTSYMQAGFTRAEAMDLLKTSIMANGSAK